MRLSMRFSFAVGGKDGEEGNSLGRWVERRRGAMQSSKTLSQELHIQKSALRKDEG